jgi:hypothetical protein
MEPEELDSLSILVALSRSKNWKDMGTIRRKGPVLYRESSETLRSDLINEA